MAHTKQYSFRQSCVFGLLAFSITVMPWIPSCGKSSGGMDGGAQTGATQPNKSDNGSNASNGGSNSSSSSTSGGSNNTSSTGGSSADAGDFALVLGYDGTNDFSSLAPIPASAIEVTDSSIVKVESVTYKYSAETINTIVEDFKKEIAALPAAEKAQAPTEAQFRQMLSADQQGSKIVPLKAGNTTLKFKPPMGAGAQGGGEEAPPPMTIRIVSYTAAQIELGKKRYASTSSGTTRACTSCHGGTTPSAPPHQLGNVAFASDAKIVTWLKEGKPFWPTSAGAPASTVEHKWEFASADEEIGIVGYLRTLQEKNMEALAKLELDYYQSKAPAK